MFKNFKVIAHLASPLCAVDDIILDSIISAAACKEMLQDDYFSGSNTYGTKEMIDEVLSKILDKQYGVYCASFGFGEKKESVSNWVKRFDSTNDDLIKFKDKVKQRVDIGGGTFKNYHMPIVLKNCKSLTFYVRGDMDRIKYLLENYIFYLGKKPSQGYGEIRNWEFIEIDRNISVLDGLNAMRNIPFSELNDNEFIENYISNNYMLTEMPVIPPYWRQDHKMLCYTPQN